MPPAIRLRGLRRWRRTELVAWIDAGCPTSSPGPGDVTAGPDRRVAWADRADASADAITSPSAAATTCAAGDFAAPGDAAASGLQESMGTRFGHILQRGQAPAAADDGSERAE